MIFHSYVSLPEGITHELAEPSAEIPRFWSFLLSARDPISEIPIERFDVDELYDEDRGVPGKVYVREGGFIPGVEEMTNGKTGRKSWEGQVE